MSIVDACRCAGGRVAGLSRAMRCALYERDGWACVYCRTPVIACAPRSEPRAASVDHVRPVSRGGETLPGNMVTCCMECNVRKGAATWRAPRRRAVDIARGRVVARFLYPRGKGAEQDIAALRAIGVNAEIWGVE